MLPNLWEQITRSPFSSLTLWGCHQRIVSCSGIWRREVAEGCSAPFSHGSCNIQTASQKEEGKKGRHTWLLLPLHLLPDQDHGSVTPQLLCWGELNDTERETKTRHQQGPGEGRGDDQQEQLLCWCLGFSRTGSVEGWHHGSLGNPESRPWNDSRGAIRAGPSAPNPEVKYVKFSRRLFSYFLPPLHKYLDDLKKKKRETINKWKCFLKTRAEVSSGRSQQIRTQILLCVFQD